MAQGDVHFGSKGEMLAASRCFPLCPWKQTSGVRAGMSELCQTATSARYSITLSARASKAEGSSMPIARAVCRLMLR
jgi:hypothetical protein